MTGLWKQPEFTQNKHHFLSVCLTGLTLSRSVPNVAHMHSWPYIQTLTSTIGARRVGRVWVQCSGMASAGGTLHSDNINDITRCHTVWHSCSDTYSLYYRTSQTALSSTCLQHYLPQSLPRSLIPAVSAHVISVITRHACIFALHFLSLLLLSCCFNSRTWRTKPVMFKDKEKEKRLVTDTHFPCFPH